MIAIVHSIYSQSVHALALNAGSMDIDAGLYCISTELKNVVRSLDLNKLRLNNLKTCQLSSLGSGILHSLRNIFPVVILQKLYVSLVCPQLTDGLLAWGSK